MQFALDSSGTTINASKGAEAVCPQCKTKVIPKCGEIVVHHWAHEAAECDPWWESESAWHRKWKGLVQKERVEVTRGPHRADIVRTDGTVVELQHSPISVPEILEREAFYGKMVWLFDGTDLEEHRLNLRPRGKITTFRWKHPRKHYGHCRKPVYIDLGDRIFKMDKLYLDKPPYGGYGKVGDPAVLKAWLAESSTCGTCSNASAHSTSSNHLTGFINCKLLPSYKLVPQHSFCCLSPARWQSSALPVEAPNEGV